MSFRLWYSSAFLILITSGPVGAQPPSPLELVRGLREAGMADLALEYLKEIENKPLSESDKQAIILERAKCLLDSAEDEPDEGTRTSMVGEAKEGFNDFLVKYPSHPRASEAAIAVARLTAIEATTQLNRARRIDVGDDDKLRKQQREESEAARPLFLYASKKFAEAAEQIKKKLTDGSLDPGLKAMLTREAFEADFAAAINQYHMAETFLATDAKQTIERSKFLEEARNGFGKLAKGPPTSRTVWIARAWMAETLMDQSKPLEGDAEFKAILAVNYTEAEEGKRVVRFFQVRRGYLGALQDRTPAKLQASEKELRAWLSRYGSSIKPTPEAISTRFYLAYTLQIEADLATPKPKSGPLVVGQTARRQYDEAEKLYRILSQSDNDYTARSSRNRMHVVRMLVGEAEKPAIEYNSFETAQMAALIQMAKLSDAENELNVVAAKIGRYEEDRKVLSLIGGELTKRKIEGELKDRKFRILSLLERARELATEKDSPGDVTDNLLRLVYFYQLSNQPYQAAVLGEHIARSIKSTGGKAALAGLLGINGYVVSSTKIKVDNTDPNNTESLEAATAARRADRDRAYQLARYVDEKFPNDTATDAARHRLADMLREEGKIAEAFEMIVKVRPGYVQAASARLLEGYLASQLVVTNAKDMPLPPGGKLYVFRRAIADLNRVVKPAPTARDEEVRAYLSVRARLAQLYLAQSRAGDKEADAAGPGYEKSLAIANEIIALVPTFECLKSKDSDKPNPKGLEMYYQGVDVRTRALYLQCRALVDAKEHDLNAATAAIEPVVADVEKTGALYDEKMKRWAGGQGDTNDDPEAAQKARVAPLVQAIDRTRREIVMLGFKLRVRQGKTAEATKMLDLLVKAGGTIEENQPTLEFMARDLASQIPILKKNGQAAEAKAMGDGLAILLKRLSIIPNLNSTTILFLGQTLYMVEQYEDALKEFAKIQVPVPPKGADPAGATEWWKVDPNKLPNNPDKKKFQEQIRDYRLAQLYTAQSLCNSKKLADAEKLLIAAIGTPEKHGYAFFSFDYRKESAHVFETKGAAISDVKQAYAEWAKAMKEWTTMYNFARAGVTNLKDPTPEQERLEKNRFFDTYLDLQRCLIEANSQVLKGNPKLAQTFTDVGKKIADMETAYKFAELEKKGDGLVTPEVWTRYCNLLDKYPELKNGYKAAGGKFFLERPKE